MVVIADTSPLNYLTLIGQIELLSRLFHEVLIPEAVLSEMLHPGVPEPVALWIATKPDWVRVTPSTRLAGNSDLDDLGSGERAAIALAETLTPEVLLVIDEGRGRRVAEQRDIPHVGTLGVLDLAAARGWIDLPAALSALQRTDFHVAPALIERLLARDRSRKAETGD